MASSKVLSLFDNFNTDDLKDYQLVKKEILQFYALNPDAYKKKVLTAKQETGESFRQYVKRVQRWCSRWQDPLLKEKTYEQLKEFYLKEHILESCDNDLVMYLKEKGMHDMPLEKFIATAETYQEIYKEKQHNEKKTRTYDCFLCGRVGHIAADCQKKNNEMKLIKCYRCGENGHISTRCSAKNVNLMKSIDEGHASKSKDQQIHYRNGLPTEKGKLCGNEVSIVRDSGCNTVVVNKKFVPKNSFTGDERNYTLAEF